MIEVPKYSIGTYDPTSPIDNCRTDFTRRIPSLPRKNLERDAKIARQLCNAQQKSNEALIATFVKTCRLLSNPRYWETLRSVWVAAGSTETAPLFRRLMKSIRPCRGWFMTVEDANALDAMQFPLTVWRAYDAEPDPGISWTIDREWCEGYARSKGRQVKERQVMREEIFAYVTRRGESEIILLD